jgi:hypothetical protein
VTRARDSRVARLEEAAANDAAVKGLDRCTPRAWRTVCAIVREELMRSGIDPARATALRLGEARDTPELGRADEEFEIPCGDSLAAKFATKIADNARRYEDGHEPDFGNASLAELFAWSLAPRADGTARPA